MTWPPADSPIYPILRVLIRAAILFAALWLFYSRLDARDIQTMLLAVLVDAGLSGVGYRACQKKHADDSKGGEDGS